MCSHLRGWSCASQEAARAGSHAQIPAEGLQQAPGPALNLGSLCRRGAEGFWSARGTRWVLRGQNQTSISWSSKRQHTNLQISILWHQEAGPPWLRQMKAGGVTAGTIPEVTAATLGLFTLQGKSGSVKSLSLQRVRNNPPPYLQGKGKNPRVYLAAGFVKRSRGCCWGWISPGWEDSRAAGIAQGWFQTLQAEPSTGSHRKGVTPDSPGSLDHGTDPAGNQLSLGSSGKERQERWSRAVLRASAGHGGHIHVPDSLGSVTTWGQQS